MTNNEAPQTSNRDKYIVKVQKLLAKAEAASTEEEADAFFAKVTQLMTAWEIDDNELRDRGIAGVSDEIDEVRMDIGSYTPKADAIAMNTVATALNIRGGFKPYSSGSPAYMRFIGRASDLERFQMMWTSLNLQMIRQMKKDEPKGVTRGDLRTWRQSFKISFCQAAATKIRDIRKDYGAALVRVDTELDDRADSEFGRAKRSHMKRSYAGSAAGSTAGRNADVNSGSRVGGAKQKSLGA